MHVPRLGMVVVAVVLGWPSSLWAWGDVGHKIVCEIAFHELNDTARAKVTELIGRDPEFQSFADSCIWPDHPKRRRVEHFLNVERTVATVTSNDPYWFASREPQRSMTSRGYDPRQSPGLGYKRVVSC